MSFVNIIKHAFARVYLNIYEGGDFTEPSQLTGEAAAWEFFLPTTKRKQSWRHWLGAAKSGQVSYFKAGFIILIDGVLFFPRLAINIVKFFTEVIPDVVAQLFFWAAREAKKEFDEKNSIGLTLGYGLAYVITALLGGLFKLVYFLGCCITSPIATSLRARRCNYYHPLLPKFLSETAESVSFPTSHLILPGLSCSIVLLLAGLLIPGLGFLLTIPLSVVVGIIAAYILVDNILLSFLNRNPNGDDLFENGFSNEDPVRYSDMGQHETIGLSENGISYKPLLEDPKIQFMLKKSIYLVQEERTRTLLYGATDPSSSTMVVS